MEDVCVQKSARADAFTSINLRTVTYTEALTYDINIDHKGG